MSNARLPWFCFLVMLISASNSWWRDYALLPARMASHFDANGLPNAWMSKDQFSILCAILAGLAAFIGFVPAFLISKLPPAMLNLPNKDYWLAPARRKETVAFFQRWFAWFACAFLVFMVWVMNLVFESNVSSRFRLPTGSFMFVLFGFLIFTAVWSVIMYRRFSKTAS